MSNYNQLKEVLNDIFELNKADLDFGIYRIMNQKRKQVNEFIEKQLPEDIKIALSETKSSDKTEIENDLKELKKKIEALDEVAESHPKYIAKLEQLKSQENTDGLEQEVFSHLANFFRRYYKDGDFISMRRYKSDVYAIPYEGEEVKLHWANHDQYYIKSSENFKNYTFKTGDGKMVHFQLKEVSTEQSNNKVQGDAERRFAIYSDLPVEDNNGELIINFIYEPVSKVTKQETLISEALEILSTKVPSTFTSVFTLSPTEKNTKRTLLEKHLSDFVSKNSFDYFIHKDLGGFLNRELDFYIKNEVLYLDDVNTKQTEFFVAQLSKVKAVKAVSQKIIEFLAQIENFQKKLWLKKKFVISTDYCITIDKIPADFYPEIIINKAQVTEWKTLFCVDIQATEQLVFEPFLVLDTKFFDVGFKDRLLATFDDLDEQTDGILINSDNFQALNILTEKWKSKVNFVYADPPYNAKSSEILYLNTFKHSSWITMMENRIKLAAALKATDGSLVTAIDENEITNLKMLFETMFPFWQHDSISIVHNPAGVQGDNFSYSHEYAIYSYEKSRNIIGKTKREEDSEEAFRDWGGTSSRSLAKNCFYPIIVQNDKIIGFGDVSADSYHPESSNVIDGDKIYIYPIADDGEERKWVFARQSVESIEDELRVKKNNGVYTISRIKSFTSYKTVWSGNQFYANIYGSKLLNHIFGDKKFDFPKSIHTLEECAFALNSFRDPNAIAIDYFAGSGTTGHATIKINREHGGKRKYILIEMGTYFNTVTKPRIQKVIYSDNWKNGKPQDKAGISQIVKYQVLESYEDALNNLYLNNKIELDFNGKAKEEYLLQYMLELESRDHLFNLEMFQKPFDYQLKVTENNELKPAKVDLVETFNYLIGLYVSKVQRVKDIKVVEGTTRTGIKTLVIWRDLETTTHEEVEKLLRRFYDSQRTKEFQQIYINGDHHLENLRSEGDQFKIKLIEETFFKKMFNEIEL